MTEPVTEMPALPGTINLVTRLSWYRGQLAIHTDKSCFRPRAGGGKLFLKEPDKIFGFVGHKISVTIARVCCRSTKASGSNT